MTGTRLDTLRADITQRAILDAACAILESAAVEQLTVREVGRRSGISERTIFRYFPMRDAFLDAVAVELIERMDLPPNPASLAGLLEAPRAFFARFEAASSLVKASLHSDLAPRIRALQSSSRWSAVRGVLDRAAPEASAHERKLAAATIRYLLSATTWHYYRSCLGLGFEDTVGSVESAIRAMVAALRARRKQGTPERGRRS